MSDKERAAQIPDEGELNREQLEGVAGGIIVINSKLNEPPEPVLSHFASPPPEPVLAQPPEPVKGFGH